jgi:hypothetical protein
MNDMNDWPAVGAVHGGGTAQAILAQVHSERRENGNLSEPLKSVGLLQRFGNTDFECADRAKGAVEITRPLNRKSPPTGIVVK